MMDNTSKRLVSKSFNEMWKNCGKKRKVKGKKVDMENVLKNFTPELSLNFLSCKKPLIRKNKFNYSRKRFSDFITI
jgi:hypothetical protein